MEIRKNRLGIPNRLFYSIIPRVYLLRGFAHRLRKSVCRPHSHLRLELSQVSAGEWVVLRYHPKRSDLYVHNCRLMVRGFGLPTLTHSPCVPDRLPARGLLHHLSGTHNTTSPCGFSEALPRSAPRGFAAPLDIISITHCQPKVKCF